MESYIGVVETVKNTQVIVRVSDPNYKSSKKTIEAWNNISAKVGEKILFEEQPFDQKRMLSMTIGIPIFAAIAGFVFGGVMAVYFNADIWLCRVISTALWLLAALLYIVPLRKNMASKKSYFVVTKVMYD